MQGTAERAHRLAFLGIAALFIAADLLGVKVSDVVQLSALAIGVALLGIPHGAVDPLLARVSGVTSTLSRTLVFYIAYIAIAGVVVGLWLLAPALSLSAFLALSIWHFRGDWLQELSLSEASAVAATVVCAPALFHPDEIAGIFSVLAFGATVEPLVAAARLVGGVSIVLLISTVVGRIRRQRLAMLELISLPLLAWLLPPLLFFVVYFCGLHSPRHIIESARVLSWRSPMVRLTALSTSVVTVFAAVGIYASLPAVDATPRLLAVIFIGLAALTVPHMLLLEFVASRRTTAPR